MNRLFIACAVWTIASAAAAEDAPLGTYSNAVLIRVEGPIHSMLEQYVMRRLDAAREQEADLVVLEIESPGGDAYASFRIAERLLTIGWARTVAYIPSEAISGAAIVALGCHEIVMAPTARMGDAGVITVDVEKGAFRYVPAKQLTVWTARVRGLAEERGRPPALAEAMMDKDVEVFHVKHRQTGETAIMSDDEIQSSAEPDQWETVQPVLETRQEKFFMANGRRAVELHVADGLAADRKALGERFHLTTGFQVMESTWVDTSVYVLNTPFVTGLLFVVGLVALYLEFSAPGIGVGGFVSAICFAIFFWSRFLGGTAGWLEVVLFALGVGFVAMELFVIPGFGFSGVTGLLLMVASIVMAGQDFVVPRTAADVDSLRNSLVVVVCSGIAFCLAAFGLSRHLGSLPVFSRLVLSPPVSDDDRPLGEKGQPADVPPPNRFGLQVGDWGVAESALRPAGKVMFGERYLDAVTDGSFVSAGEQVRVLEISGNRIVVRHVDK